MQFDAIIVGARVAGCAMAFALAQRGWHVALVERKHRPLGGTLSLPITQPRALARFRDLGLLPLIEAIMPRLKQVRSYSLELSHDITIAGDCPAFEGFDFGVILRREVLDDAFLSRLSSGFVLGIPLFLLLHSVNSLMYERTGTKRPQPYSERKHDMTTHISLQGEQPTFNFTTMPLIARHMFH